MALEKALKLLCLILAFAQPERLNLGMVLLDRAVLIVIQDSGLIRQPWIGMLE